MTDISLMIDNVKFNYRVAILFEYNDKVLLQKNGNNSYWSLIGGRVKSGENTTDAIIREVEEEIGIKIEDPKLIHMAENFFTSKQTKFHEILFIFKIIMTSNDELVYKQDFESIDKGDDVLHWFFKKEIIDLTLQPKKAKELLYTDTLTHSIIKN